MDIIGLAVLCGILLLAVLCLVGIFFQFAYKKGFRDGWEKGIEDGIFYYEDFDKARQAGKMAVFGRQAWEKHTRKEE